jgi:delta24-sterol reductase
MDWTCQSPVRSDYATDTPLNQFSITSMPAHPAVSHRYHHAPTTMESHHRRVRSISDQVRRFHDSGIAFRIYHGSTNSTRTVVRRPEASIDISKLDNILIVDTVRNIASVEPNVPMDKLDQATLEYGLLPPVIPEFPGITVGGGFAGCAGESSSFKFGFLDTTVDAVEVVLGNSSVRQARVGGNEEEKELFQALSGTLGTMGVLTRLDIRLIEAKQFVQLTYHPVRSFQEATNTIERAMEKTAENDFVDGIMYSPTKGAIVTGKMTSNTHGGKITQFSRSTDEWCFIHVEEMISKQPLSTFLSDSKSGSGEISESATQPITDFVPLTDYLFRYDRGAFWMGKYGCKHFLLPFTKTVRTLLDSLFHTREMYTALHASKMQQHHIVQDLAVPIKQTVSFLEYLENDFGIYPLWLCPLKYQATGLALKSVSGSTEMMLNVGVWGPWNKKHKSFKGANLALERKVQQLGGQKWLYAQTFYSREQFWDIYDRSKYERLRVKYAATRLPDVYQKVKQPDEQNVHTTLLESIWQAIFSFWLIGGLYGLFQAWRRANYVLKR